MRVDTHAHIFIHGLALAAGRRYAPDYEAPLAAYLKMLDGNGMSHGVLVQPSFLGTDNSYLCAALQSQPRRLRGIAVVEPTISREDLAVLNQSGCVGVRLNLIGKPDPDLNAEPWSSHLAHIAVLGWQVEIQCEAGRLVRLLPALAATGVAVVIDHFSRPDAALGIDDPGFRALLRAGASGRVWVKLSGAYRLGSKGAALAAAAAPQLLAAFGPSRLLWGSDWPHTQFETVASPSGALASLTEWVPTADDRDIILGDTPARLFRFSVP